MTNHGDRARTVLCARPGDVPLLEETIGACLRRAVERFPEREALVCRSRDSAPPTPSSGSSSTSPRAGFSRAGSRRATASASGRRTASSGSSSSTQRLEQAPFLVNVNPAYKATELEHALNKVGVKLLVHSRGFRQTDYGELLDEVRERCPALEQVLVLEDGWDDLLAAGAGVEARCSRSARRHSPRRRRSTSSSRPARPACPKGATLSHRNILNNGYFNGRTLRYTEHDRICVPVPFYHCFGCVMGNLGAVTHGACVVVPSEAFDPLAVLEAVSRERCTSLYGVPTMFIAALEEPRFAEFDLSSLRTGIMAGAPCPIEVMKRVRADMHMDEVTIACGMTETSPVSTQTAVDDPVEKRVSTIGRAHPHVEVKIVDPATGETVPRGVPGEQCTRGYSVMLGYWGDDEATASAIDGERLDAHRRPLDDGRGRLRQHRRPDQGHDHPWRREHLPARDRGVPAHAGRAQRRLRDRRPERAVRRRGDGVGQAPRRRRGDARGARRSLPREDRDATRSRATGSSSTRSR